MPMIDLFKTQNKLLSYDELDNPDHERNDDQWTYYGEPNVHPQFAVEVYNFADLNSVDYYELTTEDSTNRSYFFGEEKVKICLSILSKSKLVVIVGWQIVCD